MFRNYGDVISKFQRARFKPGLAGPLLETSEVISFEYPALLLVELFFGQMIKETKSFFKSFSDFFELSKLDQQIEKTSECLFKRSTQTPRAPSPLHFYVLTSGTNHSHSILFLTKRNTVNRLAIYLLHSVECFPLEWEILTRNDTLINPALSANVIEVFDINCRFTCTRGRVVISFAKIFFRDPNRGCEI